VQTYFKNDNQISVIDRPIIQRMEREIIDKGLVTSSKLAVGFMMLRTWPNYNSNFASITKETLQNALSLNVMPKINIDHQPETMIGYIGKMQLVNDRLYGVGIIDRPMLEYFDILPEDLPNYGTSVEVRFKNWDYFCNGRIYKRKDYPELESKVQDILDGEIVTSPKIPRRVGILWGGINGQAEINSHSILLNSISADKESSCLLAVAERQINFYQLAVEFAEERLQNKNDINPIL